MDENEDSPLTAVALIKAQHAITMDSKKSPACFSDLPKDIRLRIWRLSCPNARLLTISGQQPVQTSKAARNPQHPVTLYVNRESRAETQRFYTMLFLAEPFFESNIQFDLPSHPLYEAGNLDPTACFSLNPLEDMIEVDFSTGTFSHIFEYMVRGWRKKYPQCINSIRQVCITDVVDPDPEANTERKILARYAESRNHGCFLKHLHNLKEVTLVLNENNIPRGRKLEVKQLKAAFTKFFLEQKLWYPNRSKPKIQVVGKMPKHELIKAIMNN